MKFTNKVDASELDAKRYAMPTKGTDVNIKVNDVDTVAKITEGKGQSYTYFIFKNVSLYVPGKLEEGAEFDLDVPDDFGADEPPAGRKSYYVSKKASKLNEDGSIPAGGGAGSTDADEAAVTVDDGTPDEHSELPDGTVVNEKPATEEEARSEEQVDEVITGHDGPADEQGDAAGTVAPKNRRKSKVAPAEKENGKDEPTE